VVRHDVECQSCRVVFEAGTTDGTPCPGCGSRQTLWLPQAMTQPIFQGFWHPHLGHEPVYIDSAKGLDRALDAVGGYIKPARKTGPPERLPQTYEEAQCTG